MKSGENLIFIISQPRSGSTLLQHIFGSHSAIHTLPEPWLMLHLVYGLRSSGVEADYNAQYAYANTKHFIDNIPNGETVYVESIRKMTNYLYESALESSGKKFFLDKTPRYYFIIPDLYRIFPKAKFVFILRNPLAVLSSILTVNFNGNWQGLFQRDRKHDILTAPHLILEGIEELGDKAIVVHYEQLVSEPTPTIENLCRQMGIIFEQEMLTYGDKIRFDCGVDPKSIYKHKTPVQNYVDNWLKGFDTPQKVYIARKYLEILGKKTINEWGYSYDDLMNKLNSSNGKRKRQFLILSWQLISTPLNELSCLNRLKFLVFNSLHEKGFWYTIWRSVKFILRKIHFLKRRLI